MSYTIVYDRRVFKVGEDKYITMYSAGDNNVFEIWGGREIACKNWYQVTYKGESILSKEELALALDYLGDSDCIAKSRYNFFDRESKEFKKWVLSGVSRAITVEDAVSQSIRNRFIICDEENKDYFSYAKTTEDLLSAIESFKASGKKIRLKLDCREFKPKRREFKPKEKIRYEKFFAIQLGPDGDYENHTRYLVSIGRTNYKYYYQADIPVVKKFKTEKEAQRYVDKYKQRFLTRSNTHIRVAEINKPAML